MSYTLLIYIYIYISLSLSLSSLKEIGFPSIIKKKKKKWSLSVFQSNPRDILNAPWIDNVRLGMTMEQDRDKVRMNNITRLAGTWSNPTLMGQVLPNLLNNRVGFEFKKLNPKRVRVRFGFYAYPAQTRPIYTYNIKTNLKP